METPDSTAIRAIRYDEERQRLLVRFIDGDDALHHGPAKSPPFVRGCGLQGRFFAEIDQGPLSTSKLT